VPGAESAYKLGGGHNWIEICFFRLSYFKNKCPVLTTTMMMMMMMMITTIINQFNSCLFMCKLNSPEANYEVRTSTHKETTKYLWSFFMQYNMFDIWWKLFTKYWVYKEL
jgi:hypothetical protein